VSYSHGLNYHILTLLAINLTFIFCLAVGTSAANVVDFVIFQGRMKAFLFRL